MPLAALALVHLAVGLAVAALAARELRASPRAFYLLPSFAALALHELLVAAPAAFYLLVRHTDWMLSYTLTTGRLPSAAMLVVSAALTVGALGAYAFGARMVRDHRAAVPVVLAAVLAGAAVLGLAAVRARVGVVGTTGQYRGGFGMAGLWSSRASTALLLTLMVQGGALAQLAWAVSRAPGNSPSSGALR